MPAAADLAPSPDLAPAPQRGGNQRLHPRLACGLSAHCQIDGRVSQDALGDLSAGGLYLRTREALQIGARVRIVLGLPYIGGQRICSLSGRVMWLDRDPEGVVTGCGVQFDAETDSADHELLRGFLALWGTDPVESPALEPTGA
jgi:hypothetical protein